MKLTVVALIAIFAAAGAQKSPNFWDNRNTIVHLFEWKYNDIADECERFLQHKGYGGVQISPVTENLIVANRPWYERYQPISYHLITRSGNEQQLASMVKRCNKVGIRVYVDVLLNHMTGPAKNAVGTGGSKADPANKLYPEVPYGPDDFHASCAINDYNNPTEARNCELSNLKDLRQRSDYVRGKLINLLNKLVDLGVAGFRVDAAKHIWPKDLEYIYGKVKNLNTDHGFPQGARPFFYQEVIELGAGGGAISKTEYTSFGRITEFKVSNELSRVFRGKDKLAYLKNWGPEWGLSPSGDALVFIDNHDNQRAEADHILTYKNPKHYKMATAFMLAHTYGITRIMSSFAFENFNAGPPQNKNGEIISPGINADGTCSNGWVCEHRWREMYSMVGFKNAVKGTSISNWWSNGDQQIAFSRGKKGFIAITNGGDINTTLQTGLPQGTYCDIITGDKANASCTGKTVTVNGDGTAHISLRQDEFDGVIAIHVNAKL